MNPSDFCLRSCRGQKRCMGIISSINKLICVYIYIYTYMYIYTEGVEELEIPA